MHTEKNELTETKLLLNWFYLLGQISRDLPKKKDKKSQFKICFFGWASNVKYNFDPWP